MHHATSEISNIRLAIAPGVASSHLSALLALQREEEPEVTIVFSEVTSAELISGLRQGRYDAGISLEGLNAPPLKSLPLWRENMAVALPTRCPLLDKAKLTLVELLHYPIFRWQAETCPLLEQQISSLMPASQPTTVERVTSFEMMALWITAGYGIGVSAQSRIAHVRGRDIDMRPFLGGPYEIVTHLQRLNGSTNPVSERFERRALQVARLK